MLGKFSLCSLTLASGIALGREGPSVQVSCGIASVLGRRLGLSQRSVRALVPIGAAAALAAAFNTPIAAVLFTLEEVMGDMHAPVLGSIVLSSATSWMVLHLLLGDNPLFHVPAYQLVHPVEFVFYAALGVVGGLVSVAFVKLLLWQRKHFLRMPQSTVPFQPVVGGLLIGLFGWFVPQAMGVGYGFVDEALNGKMVLAVMALLVCLKVVGTATCYASGNAGGIFGPSLFMGAMMGGAFGGVAHMLLPDYTASVGAYALVGMGAAFAGIIRTPLTSVIMIFEITRDYTIIVPLMIANLIAYFISSRLQEEPIYEALLHQDGIHLPGGARTREEPLITVGQAFRRDVDVLSADERIGPAAGSRRPHPPRLAGGGRHRLARHGDRRAARRRHRRASRERHIGQPVAGGRAHRGLDRGGVSARPPRSPAGGRVTPPRGEPSPGFASGKPHQYPRPEGHHLGGRYSGRLRRRPSRCPARRAGWPAPEHHTVTGRRNRLPGSAGPSAGLPQLLLPGRAHQRGRRAILPRPTS